MMILKKKNQKDKLDLLANGVTMRIDKLCPKNRRLQAGSMALFQDDSQEQVNRREQGQASDRTAGAGKQIR